MAKQVFKFADENTCKSIFNKLTVIMISCVILPVIVQNIYNLYFTHPGQQLFWEDIESIAITAFLLCMMLFDSWKKTKKLEGKTLTKQVIIHEIRREKVVERGEGDSHAMAGIPPDLADDENS